MQDDLQGRSILVTGGAGFIGKHLVDTLVPRNDVCVVDDLSTGNREYVDDRATFIEGDIRDSETMARATEGIDVIFHEAGVIDVEESVENLAATDDVNCDGTLQVLEAAKRRDTRVVLASSTAVYGQPSTTPVAETEPKEPLSPYGVQKLSLDHYARLYDALYGIETVSLRYFNVYGPYQSKGGYSGVISRFLDRASRGDPLIVHGEGAQTRDFVHVDDVVQANLLAATADVSGEAYNVGTGWSIAIRDLAKLVRELADADVDIVHEEARDADIERSVADIEKARSQLGYEPTITVHDGIGRLYDE